MKTTLIALLLTLAVVSADLGKSANSPGIDAYDLGDSFQSAGHSLNPTDDQDGCETEACSSGIDSVFEAAYDDGVTVKICICNDAVSDENYLADKFGAVPQWIRQETKILTSGSQNTCTNIGAAYSKGSITAYCQEDLPLSVFVHEAAHNVDFQNDDGSSKSESQEWQDALGGDSCVPSDYANTNPAEDFAEVAVVWMWTQAGNGDVECMQHQLDVFRSYAPEGSGDAPQQEDGGDDEPAPEDGGDEPAPEDGGDEPAPEDGGDEPAPEDGGDEPAPEDGGDAPQEEVPQEEVPQEEIPQEEAPQEEVPQEEVPQEEVPQEEAPQEEVLQEEAPQEAPKEEAPQDEGLFLAFI